MKIAIISCYKDPDYIRTRVLRTALSADPRTELIVIKNKQKNILRYPEVLFKIVVSRFRQKPDVYLLSMRAEILPLLLVLAWPHPVVYDEMVNFIEWFVYEHHYVQPRSWPAQILATWYSSWLRHCQFVLADTKSHAAYSAALSGVSHSLYRTIPVGTDERLFKPQISEKQTQKFEIFYYGSMLPLHGLNYVLEAAEQLTTYLDISFYIVGGGRKANQAVQIARANGANIRYKPWIAFNQLARAMHQANLCLAGPFGNTEQSQLIITGKTYQMLASGVPTLIGRSNASGVFTDKVDCLLVPQGDSSALLNKIIWAFENKKKLSKIGVAGNKLYNREFSNQAISAKLSGLVDELSVAIGDSDHVR